MIKGRNLWLNQAQGGAAICHNWADCCLFVLHKLVDQEKPIWPAN